MGIYGLGACREQFARRGFVPPNQYAACLDVSHFVVNTIRSCSNELHFEHILSREIRYSREMAFMKWTSPARLHYTLDRGSPKAKRWTQESRKMASQVPLIRALNQQNQRYHQRAYPNSVYAEVQFRTHQVVHIVRRVLLSPEFRPAPKCEVTFDYERGEGEIKAIRWLYAQSDLPVKLVLSRDNDVFPYAMAVLMHRPHDPSPRLMVFHEGSNSVLACWQHLVPRYGPTCWVFLLWMSICFGNDYVHGILPKTCESVERHLKLLREGFAKYRDPPVYRDDMFRHPTDRIVAKIDASRAAAATWDDDDGYYDETSGRCERLARLVRGCDTASTERRENGADILTAAIVRLQRVLIDDDEKDGDDGDDENEKPRQLVDVTDVNNWRVHCDRRKKSKRRAKSYAFATTWKSCDPAIVRAWLGRQVWSLLYILELPVNFVRNETFSLCPSVLINVELTMPTLTRAHFLGLREETIRREIATIVEHGLDGCETPPSAPTIVSAPPA